MARRYNNDSEYFYDDDPDDYTSDPEELRRQMILEKRRRREARRRARYRKWLIKRIITVVALVLVIGALVLGGIRLVRFLTNGSGSGDAGSSTLAEARLAAGDASADGSNADGTSTEGDGTDVTDGTDSADVAEVPTLGHPFVADDNTVYLAAIHRTEETDTDVPEATSSEADTGTEPVVEETDFDQQFIDASKAIGFSGEGNDYVASEYAILVNADTGEIVLDREAEVRMVPASMTKVLTVLVAAEHLTDEATQLQDKVTITQDIVDQCWLSDSSSMYYIDGDQITVEELFYGTILQSGADAAFALANYIAGSEESFVALMNEKCEELGISSTTHMTNPVGIYDVDHYSTAYDMAVIMQAAMENEFCRKVLSTHSYEAVPSLSYPDGGHVVSNWFLRRIEDKDTHGTVVGAKTGYVSESGCCAVSYQTSEDGTNYICCTADSWGSWRTIYDHVAIYSHFTN